MERDLKIIPPEEYFFEIIKVSAEKRKIHTEPEDQMYLTNLLSKYIRATNFHRPIQTDSLEAPPNTFAEMYLTAISADEYKKKELLQIVGDRSLYIVGYFPESISKKIVSEDYYVAIGSAAYRNLHTINKKSALSKLYKRFSERFVEFANILKDIRLR